MKTVFIAGATGYLGQYLATHFYDQGWRVIALVRDAAKAKAEGLKAHEFVQAQATDPQSLSGIMDNVDLIVSSLGITRQRDGLSYRDVDYQANLNLLNEAVSAGVTRFCYIHVLNGAMMAHTQLVGAKQAFVEALQAAPIASTIIEPSGYFSDMGDFLQMAKTGHVFLFGDGQKRLNPIHGADLAAATFDAIAQEKEVLRVGGPDIFTHDDLAKLAFEAVGKPVKIWHLPSFLIDWTLWGLTTFTSPQFYGPIEFFLTALRADMVGEQRGTHHLADHFAALVATDQTSDHSKD